MANLPGSDLPVDQLPKDKSGETTPGKASNAPGVYEHKPTGKRLIVLPDPTTNAQADALVRMGFELVGPPPTPLELRKMQNDQVEADKLAPADTLAVLQTDVVAPIYNGSSDRMSAADKDSALKAATARAEAAEAALAEAVDFTKADEVAAPADPEKDAETVDPEPDETTPKKEGK